MATLISLSGRIPLWEFALGHFESIREWALGFGYGSSRVILLAAPEFSWAGSAHSVWIELLLGTGLIGICLVIATIAMLAFKLAKRRFFGPANLVSVSILGFFLIVSPILEGLVLPGIGFGLFALLHAPALAQRALPANPPIDGGDRAMVGTRS